MSAFLPKRIKFANQIGILNFKFMSHLNRKRGKWGLIVQRTTLDLNYKMHLNGIAPQVLLVLVADPQAALYLSAKLTCRQN